jgi:hypothetical protein
VEYFVGHYSQKERVKCTIFLLLLVAMGLEEAWMEKIKNPYVNKSIKLMRSSIK